MTLKLNEARDELMKQGYNYDFTQDNNYLHALFNEMMKRNKDFSEPEVKAIIREVLHAMI